MLKDKRSFKINKHNTAVFLVLLIIVYSIAFYSMQLKKQEKQFLDLYHNEMQIKNELLAKNVLLSLQGISAEGNSFDKFLEIIKLVDSMEDSTWVYVASDGIVIYYKNQDLIKENGTVSLERFIEQLEKNSMITTQSSISFNNELITIGLVVGKNMVLMDWGYNSFDMVFLLENIVVTLLLALIGIYFIWCSMKKSKEVVRFKKEVFALNRKVEEISNELNQIIYEKEAEELDTIQLQVNQYDLELVRVLLMKINDTAYLPFSIIYVQFDMGNLYFSKKRMKEIEDQLRVQLVYNYELFEIGKGEFVIIMVRTEIDDMMESHIVVEERAENIAKDNGITATVKSRIITTVTDDPFQELVKIREKK